jgi:hypothetical protein
MKSVLSDCKEIEGSSFIETKTNAKIVTNVGYIVSTNYEDIISICENNFQKMKLSKTSHEDIFVSYSNETNNNNLIITQPYLINFWEDYANENISVITNINKFNETEFNKNNVTVISHSMLNQHIHKIYTIPFKRIILHNCYKKYFHNKIRCDFKWYVFSDKYLLNHTIKDCPEEILKYILVEDGYSQSVPSQIVYSKKPIESLTLEGLVDNVILDNVNNFNIKNIIKHLTDPSIKTEKDVIRHVLRRFNEQIKNIETSEHCLEQMMFASQEDKKNKFGNLVNKKNVLLEKKNELTKRITENNLCFICYSDIEIKTILKCCSNNVCFECINKWISRNDTCPLCKQSKIQYFIVDNNEKNDSENIGLDLAEHNSIFENFQILISSILTLHSNRKVVIIGYEQMFLRKLENILRSLSIKFLKFTGNNKILKQKLIMYEESVNVMFFDYSKIDFGIPMDCVTDIIIISKYLNVNAFNRQCKNIENNWFLLYK